MNHGTGMYFLGGVGAFVLACLAGWNLGGARVPHQRSTSIQPRTLVADNDSSTATSANSGSTPLTGPALEDAVRQVAAVADTAYDGDAHYVTALYEFATRIPLQEFPRVMALLKEGKTLRNDMVRTDLLAYWLERDFKAARAYFVSLPPSERGWVDKIADAWARVDAGSLLEWLKSLPEKERHVLDEIVRSAAAEALAKRDPNLALEMVIGSGQGGHEWNSQIEKTIFEQWVQRDPQAASTRALQMPAGKSRSRALEAAFGEWSRLDMEAAKAWVLQVEEPELAAQALQEFAGALVQTDPGAALKFVIEQGALDTFPVHMSWGQYAGAEWGRRNGEEGLAWAQTIDDPKTREAVLAGILQSYAEQNPKRAADIYLKEIGNGGSLGNTSFFLIREFSKAGDAASAVQFLNQLPETELKKRAGGAVWEFGRNADYVEKALSNGRELVSREARHAWWESIFGSLVGSQGFQESQRLLERVPPGEDRSVAIGAVINEAISRNPEQVVALARSITGGDQLLVNATRRWLYEGDPTAARNWVLGTNALRPEEKKQILAAKAPAGQMADAAATGATPHESTIPRP